VIGSGSCNCHECCTCLRGNVIVPDGLCNSVGEGADQCCTAAGMLNNLYNSTFTLPVYDITPPTCIIGASGTNAFVEITCSYDVTIPDGLNETSVSSEVYASAGCMDPPPVSVTKGDSALSYSNELYQIAINITTSGENSVLFCLKTVVTDDEGNEMKYRSQVLEAKYNYTADFNLTLAAKEFKGLNTTAAADLGVVDFKMEVFRCDSSKDKVDPLPLTINDDLYVCIKSKTVEIVVTSIDQFTIKKENSADTSYNAVDDGKSDVNTYVDGEGFDTVVVATRPQASLFVDAAKIIIQGKATLGIEDNNRYLARFTQEISNEGAFSNFGMELDVVKVSSDGNLARGVGAIIAIVVGSVFIFF